MLKWVVRFFLLRVLPGRLILFMSLADLFFLLRSLRRMVIVRNGSVRVIAPRRMPVRSEPVPTEPARIEPGRPPRN